MSKLYISDRKETQEILGQLRSDLYNWSVQQTNPGKHERYMRLCFDIRRFVPSERCKEKQCVLGFANGNIDSKIVFVAEAPGRNGAERTGIPIYGDPTGDNFERILNKASASKIGRKDVFITNTFLWNPTNQFGNNDRPTTQEIDDALPWLKAQLDIIEPEFVVALGMTAYQTLNKIHPLPVDKVPMSYLAGKVFKWNDHCLLGAMYHPSPRVIGTHRTMDQMIEDLRTMFKSYVLRRSIILKKHT